MTGPPTDARKPSTGARWWIAWALVGALVAGGVVLTLRLAPGLTPVLESAR